MRPLKKGTVIYWNDPDEGACSQYGFIVAYQGDGIYSIKTARGGELEACHHEIFTVNKREARIVKAASDLYNLLVNQPLPTKEIKNAVVELAGAL